MLKDMELRITAGPVRRRGAAGGRILDYILTLLLFAALGGALTAAVPMRAAELWAPLLVGAAVCAIPFAVSRAPRGKYAYPALLAAALAVTLCLRGLFTDGVCLLYNRWCAALTASTGRFYPGVAVGAAEAKGDAIRFFTAAAIFPALCALGLRRACPRLAGVLCAAAAAALSLMTGLEGAGARIALLLAAALSSVTVQDEKTGGGALQRLLPAAFAAAVFALLLAGLWRVSPIRDGTLFAALRREAEGRVHSARYEPAPQPLPEGELTRAGAKSRDGGARLLVSMTRPETLYLRGFVGDDYTGKGWKSVSNPELAGSSDLLYWLHRSGFYPQTQASLAASAAGDGEEYNYISVKNPAACSEYIYAPYSMLADDGLTYLSPDELGVSVLPAPGRKGARQYRYACVYKAPERTEQWIEALNESGTAEIAAYRSLEAGYREFAAAHDLGVPESTRQLLEPLLEACARERGGAEEMTPALAAQCAADLAEKYLTYREDIPEMTGTEDIAEYTLNTLKGGYDVHYATLTVLALRCLGVPARYAEGYVVTEEQAAEAQGDWITLSDGSACAWAEVYQEGIGWLPLAQTPGKNAVPDGETADRVPVNTSAETEEPPQEPDSGAATTPAEETPEFSADEPELPLPEGADTPQTIIEDRLSLPAWLLIPLALLLLLAALYLRRRHILRRRERLFAQEDSAGAVSCLYAYILRLLEPTGITARGGRLLELSALLADKSGAEYAGRFAAMTDINYRALFSHKPLPEGAREEMADLRRETTARLRRLCGVWKRLRLKWINCLY